MLKHMVSKDEIPTPKGVRVMAWTTFWLKNRIEMETAKTNTLSVGNVEAN